MELWQQWQAIYQDYQDPEHEPTALAFYLQNQALMHQGAEVLWPEQESLYALMCLRATIGNAPFAGCGFPLRVVAVYVWVFFPEEEVHPALVFGMDGVCKATIRRGQDRMQVQTILHRVERHKGFVYGKVVFREAADGPVLEVAVRPRSNSRPRCSGCGRARPGYDRLTDRQIRPCQEVVGVLRRFKECGSR